MASVAGAVESEQEEIVQICQPLCRSVGLAVAMLTQAQLAQAQLAQALRESLVRGGAEPLYLLHEHSPEPLTHLAFRVLTRLGFPDNELELRELASEGVDTLVAWWLLDDQLRRRNGAAGAAATAASDAAAAAVAEGRRTRRESRETATAPADAPSATPSATPFATPSSTPSATPSATPFAAPPADALAAAPSSPPTGNSSAAADADVGGYARSSFNPLRPRSEDATWEAEWPARLSSCRPPPTAHTIVLRDRQLHAFKLSAALRS